MDKVPQSEAYLHDEFSNLNVSEDDDKLIIALDFGTTFSGIAYYFTGSGKPEPISITEWPGTPGLNPPKTPTLISYEQDKKSFIWGSKVNLISEGKLEGIKLLLDPDQPTPLFVPLPNTKKELAKLGKPPINVATDYIGALYKHALGRIEESYPKDYVQMHQKKFVLTVPAVWSDKAKDVTLRAARNAGIHPITLIKEPEAAALYTLHFLKNGALAIGDAFVLCDAGGGTVDLISYEVTALDPLKLKELVPGTGGLVGSLMLNKRFEEFVRNIVGEEDFLALRKTTGYSHAMKTFDQEVKPAFRADPDQSWYIPFPMAGLKDDPENNIQSNCLDLKSDAVRAIFDPLITAIESLVTEQANGVRLKRMEENHPKGKEIKAIFLVGGFGSSQYLKTCLEKANPDIQVIQPPDAWGAIVKGAVLSEMPQEAEITSVIATRHYGVTANSIYRESEDAGQPKIWDSFEGLYRVKKMTWYIYRGDDMPRERRIEFPFYRTLSADYAPEDLVFVDELLHSDELESFTYPGDGDYEVNCKLRVDLRTVPKTEFKNKVSIDGTPYVAVSYKLFITAEAKPVFGMTVNGKDMGTVDVDYE